jgi:hypothetical protein
VKYMIHPVVVDAFQYGIDEAPEWFHEKLQTDDIIVFKGDEEKKDVCMVRTLEVVLPAHEGDYIIRGETGELFPCRKEVFEKTFVKVEI